MADTYTSQNDVAEDIIYEAKIDKGEIEVEKPKPAYNASIVLQTLFEDSKFV